MNAKQNVNQSSKDALWIDFKMKITIYMKMVCLFFSEHENRNNTKQLRGQSWFVFNTTEFKRMYSNKIFFFFLSLSTIKIPVTIEPIIKIDWKTPKTRTIFVRLFFHAVRNKNYLWFPIWIMFIHSKEGKKSRFEHGFSLKYTLQASHFQMIDINLKSILYFKCSHLRIF